MGRRNMLGISLPELLIIFAIGICVIPSKDLPKIIQFVAKTYKKAQDFYYKVLRELNILNINND